MAEYKTDIEIAQEAEMWPITRVAEAVGLTDEQLEHYGTYKAKVDIHALRDLPRKAKLVLVTAINPTPAGEGKTTTSVGLADALTRLGKKAVLALREPSLGPVSYTHLRAHETGRNLVCRLLLEKKKNTKCYLKKKKVS